MTDQINDTLAARGSRYGNFADNAAIADALIWVMMGEAADCNSPDKRVKTNWLKLDPVKRQGLILIAQKMSRALSPSADPEYTDNWHDIQGYAKLIEERCEP